MALALSYLDPLDRDRYAIDLSHGDLGSEASYRTVHVHLLEKLQQQVLESIGRIPSLLAADCSLSCNQDLGASLRPVDLGVVFFIDGTRGAGKSTFLRAACHRLCHDLESKTAKTGMSGRPQIGFLSLIDPSRIETGEVLLLNVVTLLHKRVTANSRCISESRSQQQNLKKFQQCLEKLAGGLSLLRGDHDPLKDADPEVFLEAGLERVQHGDGLRSAVHELIDAACRVLCADALVLAFDDADTNAQKGIELMECVRKYLNSPRLVILVAGDLELYSLLTREHFITTARIGESGTDKSRNQQRGLMLHHMEEQYTLKLFPAQFRYRLVSLQALLDDRRPLSVQYVEWGSDRRVSLIDVINYLIRLGFFVSSSGDMPLYRNYFLQLPIRSVVQMLRRCVPFMEITRGKDVSPRLKVNNNSASNEVAAVQSVFVEGLRSIFAVGLFNNDVKVDAIAAGSMSALISSVFYLVVKDGQYDTGAYLRPRSQDEGIQACYVTLAGEVARMCGGRPDRFLRYLMQAVASVSVYGAHRKFFNKSPHDFARYVGLEGNEDALHWAWCTAPLLGQETVLGSLGGHEASDSDSRKQRFVARLCLAYQQDENLKKKLYCSGFVLLGLVERLLSPRCEVGDGIPSNPYLDEEILAVLERAWRISTISKFSGGGSGQKVSNERQDVSLGINKAGYIEEYKKLPEEIKRWLTNNDIAISNSDSVAVSAVFVGKVWTRLYFNMRTYSRQYGSGVDFDVEKFNPVEFLRSFMLLFLKALYIEGFAPHEYENLTNAQNYDAIHMSPIGVDFYGVMGWEIKDFKLNYDEYISRKYNERKFPVINLLLTCPLIEWLFPEWTPTVSGASDVLK